MKKIIYIVLDGLGDMPIKELSGKTPLEAALTLNLDRLAQKGKTGLVHTAGKGVAPDSDVAVICLLGYDTQKYYTGRGPLEAFAEGLAIADGNLALRVNFASLGSDGKTILDRRVGRDLSFDEASALAKEINSKVILTNATFEFKNTVAHRGVLVIRGMHSRLSGRITNTDPAYKRDGLFGAAVEDSVNSVIESQPLPDYKSSAEAVESAYLLNEFTFKSRKVLEESAINKKRLADKKLPANIILSRDAGDCLPKFPNISELYYTRFGCFVEMPVERGIALLTGMEIIDVPQSSGHLDVDYPVWAKVAEDALKKYEAIYIHIKGPDEPSHDGDFLKKKETIEFIDKYFFGSLLPKINLKDFIICVCADHTTACSLKSHSALPVPLLVVGGNIRPDGSMSFSEKAAKQGSIGELTGQEIIPLLVKLSKNQ